MAISVVDRTNLVGLVVGMFGAAPGASVLSDLVASFEAGSTLKQIAANVAGTTEFVSLFPTFLTDGEFATKVVNQLVGTTVIQSEKDLAITELTSRLQSGQSRTDVFVDAIIAVDALASTNTNWGNAAVAFDNKVAVAVYYSVDKQLSGSSLAALQAVIASVDNTAASVTAANAVSDGTADVGESFTLTTAANVLTGSAGIDTFNAVIDQATPANSTISAADSIDGGAGADVLSVTGVGTTLDVLGGALVSNIETVNIRATTANTLDASQIAGLTAVNANLGTGTVGVTNLATGASIGVIGNGTVVNGAVTFAYATAASAVTLNLAGGTKAGTTVTNGAIAGTATTTATINSTGATNSIGALDLDGNTAADLASLTINATTGLTAVLVADDYVATGAALTVTGAGKVNIGALGTFKTVDASANTGGLTMTLDTVTTSFKGSTAADTITSAAIATTTTAGIIDGGTGTDTLVVAATTDVDTAAERAVYTGFEVLSNGASASIAADGFTGITSVVTSSDGGGFTKLSAAQAASIVVSTAQTGGVTYALTTDTGTTDVLGLKMGAAAASTSAATSIAGALVVNGVETLNIAANAGASATVGANRTSTIASITADKLTKINLTGTAVDITNAATTKATTIDASALTGDGTATGSKGLTLAGVLVAGSTVTGSAFADTVTIGAITSTYNTGAGNDTVKATQTIALGSTIDGGAGTDTLDITDAAAVTVNDNTFANVVGIEKLSFSAATGLTFAVGGYANGLATANANVLDITAAALTGAVSIDGTGLSASNALKLTLTSAETAANATATTITLSRGADVVKYTATDATNSDTLTISGGVDALAATTVKTIDLSGITAGAGAIAVTTGAGADVIKAAGIDGTYTGGKGADTFTAGAGVDTFAMGTDGSTVAAQDSISGYGSAVDILTFGAATTLLAADATGLVAGSNVQQSAGGLITFAAADSTLALKIAAIQADAQLDAAGSVAVFNDGSDAYVYYAGAAIGNADDQIVHLVGITAASIAAGATTIVTV